MPRHAPLGASGLPVALGRTERTEPVRGAGDAMTCWTLARLRRAVEAAASANGDYVVRCARTGVRPVPVSGRRFSSRDRAVVAASLATRYRARLRGYDPATPVYDLVVCDVEGRESDRPLSRPAAGRRR